MRRYKSLSDVERAFRCLKSIDLLVCPIRHRLEDRVRAHIFLCMLSNYVEWHMLEAWRPLLEELGGIVRNTCRRPGAEPSEPTFRITTTPNPRQAGALALLDAIWV